MSTSLTTAMKPEHCAEKIRGLVITEHAQKIIQGWYLLHAQTAFSMPKNARGQGAKQSVATVATDYANADNPGFIQWLSESLEGFVSQRTAYNYMLAAQRAGLTLDMTEPEALSRAQEALTSVARLSDLYKLPEAKPENPNPEPPGAPEEQAQQLLLPLMDEISRSFVEGRPEEKALYLAPMATVEELEEKFRTALDMIRAVKADRKTQRPGGKRK